MVRLVILALLLLAGTAAGWGCLRAVEDLLPLELLLGPWAHVWLALLCASLAAVAWALVLELRDWRRGEPRSLAPVRAALVCAVLGAVSFLALWQPFERLWFDLWAGVTGGVYAATLILARRTLSWLAPRSWRALDFVLFNLCLALLLAEVGLRVAAHVAPSPLLAQPDLGSWQFMDRFRLQPGEIIHGFPANSGGHFDEEFGPREPVETLIAVAGDSFSVGSVHHLLHYTTIAEQRTGWRFDNYGVTGTGPREYRELLLHAALPERPDAMILSLFLGNDLALEPMLSERLHRRLRAWFALENVLAYQVPYRLRKIRAVGEQGRSSGPWLKTLEDVHREHPWVLDPALEQSPRSLESHLEIEVHRAWSICRHLDSYEPLMEILEELASVGVPFGVLIIPDEFQVEEPLWAAVLAQRAGAEDLERDRAQRELGVRLESAGIPFLDLLPLLRAEPVGPDGWRHLYHLGDTHFNARGNRVAGEALALFVEEQLLR